MIDKCDPMHWYRQDGDNIAPLPRSTAHESMELGLKSKSVFKVVTKRQLTFQSYPRKYDPRIDAEKIKIPTKIELSTEYRNEYTYYDYLKRDLQSEPTVPHFLFNRKPKNDFEPRTHANQKFMDDHIRYLSEGRKQINFFRQLRNQSHAFASVPGEEEPLPLRPPKKDVDENQRYRNLFPLTWSGEDRFEPYPIAYTKYEIKDDDFEEDYSETVKDAVPEDSCDDMEVPEEMPVKKIVTPKFVPQQEEVICEPKTKWERCYFDFLPPKAKSSCQDVDIKRELRSAENYFPTQDEWEAEVDSEKDFVPIMEGEPMKNICPVEEEFKYELVDPKPLTFLGTKPCPPPKPTDDDSGIPCHEMKYDKPKVPDGSVFVPKRVHFDCTQQED